MGYYIIHSQVPPARGPVSDAHPPTTVCPMIESAMNVLGRAWAGAVLQAMLSDAERFSEIRRAIPGITDAALTTRLRELCERGLAERTVEPGPPVAVRYTLTVAGRDTAPVLDALRAFADAHGDVLNRG